MNRFLLALLATTGFVLYTTPPQTPNQCLLAFLTVVVLGTALLDLFFTPPTPPAA